LKWRGKVKTYLKSRALNGEKLHLSLIDPDKVSDLRELEKVLRALADAGTDAFLIGGSIGVSPYEIDPVIEIIDELGIPSILFPGSIANISRKADAILFMSLLNSDDSYFIIGAQVQAAPLIKRYGLEVLPTGYLIVGYGGAAGLVGKARIIPYDRPEIAAAYALAAQYLGMEFVYLEAGSGAPEPIPCNMIKYVRKIADNVILIVGGGIRSVDAAMTALTCGADSIVTGTIIEKDVSKAVEIISSLKKR